MHNFNPLLEFGIIFSTIKMVLNSLRNVVVPFIQPRSLNLPDMKKIKMLRIQFKNEISEAELTYFRAAVVAQVDKENILFHNHDGEQFRYAYPLIQYKRIHRKAALVCLAEGTEQIMEFFQRRVRTLQIGNRPIDVEIENLYLNEITLQTWDKMFPLHLHQWMPFKAENYQEYHALTEDTDRHAMLERILRGNLLSMAKGLGWWLESEIKVEIGRIHRSRLSEHKDYQAQVFDLDFRTNVYLPEHIGIGKRAGLGFGIVGKVRERAEASSTGGHLFQKV
jgi:Cas6b C-terminal domain/Cas6b N-terminal domain